MGTTVVISTDPELVCLAGAPLPPGTQVTTYDTGMVRLHYPMPGFLALTVTCMPRRGDAAPQVHLQANRYLTHPEVHALAQLLAAADRWRALGQQTLGGW